MLLCNNQEERDSAAVDAINEGLADGQLCVYASILNGDRAHLAKISSQIQDCWENVGRGNLVIIDFYSFYESALASDLTPFNELRERIEAMLRDRVSEGKSDKVLIFAEAAGALSEHRHFDKSADLESWWNDVHAKWVKNNLKITVICPHPVLSEESANAKNNLVHAHSLTLELEKLQATSHDNARILIVEPEADIQSLYRRYLNKLGLDAVIVESGNEALDRVSSKEGFDLIMMDVHPKDNSGIEVARKILATIPDQRIVFTTTSLEDMQTLKSTGLASNEVLVKPFRISSLLSLVKPY
jgi:CheY-like chemotaxis protein